VDLTKVQWRKSSRTGGGGADSNCVEMAFVGAAAAVRDSKNPDGPMLVLPVAAWATFVKPHTCSS
jgi:hypothetical protein